ncbi:hypothetical protein [Photobacterium carnosum]|uniref:hypothetical protein n=1 Tax=Photobacterium carnosum TaxID=2023717 RepID=UPI001E54422D|nr:hypothetical protein [Photobacterium carnosum]MCD9514046.1 hypothetical protein [Photobacterium carnosum]
MTKVIAPSMHDTVYTGAAGNLSVAFGQVTLKAAAANTEVALLELPIGLKVVGVRIATAAGLGAGVKFDLKLNNVVIQAGIDVAAVSAVVIPVQPVYLKEKTVLTAVVKGAAATGSIAVMPEYVVVGY